MLPPIQGTKKTLFSQRPAEKRMTTSRSMTCSFLDAPGSVPITHFIFFSFFFVSLFPPHNRTVTYRFASSVSLCFKPPPCNFSSRDRSPRFGPQVPSMTLLFRRCEYFLLPTLSNLWQVHAFSKPVPFFRYKVVLTVPPRGCLFETSLYHFCWTHFPPHVRSLVFGLILCFAPPLFFRGQLTIAKPFINAVFRNSSSLSPHPHPSRTENHFLVYGTMFNWLQSVTRLFFTFFPDPIDIKLVPAKVPASALLIRETLLVFLKTFFLNFFF